MIRLDDASNVDNNGAAPCQWGYCRCGPEQVLIASKYLYDRPTAIKPTPTSPAVWRQDDGSVRTVVNGQPKQVALAYQARIPIYDGQV